MSKMTVTQKWRCTTAFRMRENGETNKAISEFIGVPVDKIPMLVTLGQRVESLNDEVAGEIHHD